MQRIGTILSKGKSSRELIDLGYAPGTVYKVQRVIRRSNNAQVFPANHRLEDTSISTQVGEFTQVGLEDGGKPSWAWHSPRPIPCPGCNMPVGHWDLCGDCNRLIPAACRCERESDAVLEGFVLGELLNATDKATMNTV